MRAGAGSPFLSPPQGAGPRRRPAGRPAPISAWRRGEGDAGRGVEGAHAEPSRLSMKASCCAEERLGRLARGAQSLSRSDDGRDAPGRGEGVRDAGSATPQPRGLERQPSKGCAAWPSSAAMRHPQGAPRSGRSGRGPPGRVAGGRPSGPNARGAGAGPGQAGPPARWERRPGRWATAAPCRRPCAADIDGRSPAGGLPGTRVRAAASGRRSARRPAPWPACRAAARRGSGAWLRACCGAGGGRRGGLEGAGPVPLWRRCPAPGRSGAVRRPGLEAGAKLA